MSVPMTFIIIIIYFAQIVSIQIHRKNLRRCTMIQSVSNTYQAESSTDGSLIVTPNIQRYNSKNTMALETSEEFRNINTHDRAPKL